LMVAGPNGACKTTLVRWLRRQGIAFGEYINPDNIAEGLAGLDKDRVGEAQAIADDRRDACIEARRSFSFETVMSHPSKVDLLIRARAAGFFAQTFFVGTDDPRTDVERVALRVAQGGHDVPLDRIIARWNRTMELLHRAIDASDKTYIFDNSASVTPSTSVGPRLVMEIANLREGERKVARSIRPVPDWVRHYVLDRIEFEQNDFVDVR
jgi:predicted ABC-type ATPase